MHWNVVFSGLADSCSFQFVELFNLKWRAKESANYSNICWIVLLAIIHWIAIYPMGPWSLIYRDI